MHEQVAHVTLEHQLLRDQAEHREGCCKDESISHFGAVGSDRFEEVIVLHRSERAFDHGVLEVGWPIIGGDAAGKVLFHFEVSRSPSHELTKPNQTGGHASHGLLSGLLGSKQMDLDAP